MLVVAQSEAESAQGFTCGHVAENVRVPRALSRPSALPEHGPRPKPRPRPGVFLRFLDFSFLSLFLFSFFLFSFFVLCVCVCVCLRFPLVMTSCLT